MCIITITNNIETTESLSAFEVTGNSFLISSTLIRDASLPLQFPTKTFQGNSDLHKKPNVLETFSYQNNATSHQFHFQNTATLPFSQYNRFQRNIPMYKPLTEYIKQFQNNPFVTNQPNRSDDRTYMPITITTAVLTL